MGRTEWRSDARGCTLGGVPRWSIRIGRGRGAGGGALQDLAGCALVVGSTTDRWMVVVVVVVVVVWGGEGEMRTGSGQQHAIRPRSVGDVGAIGHQQSRPPPQQLLRPRPPHGGDSAARSGRGNFRALPCPLPLLAVRRAKRLDSLAEPEKVHPSAFSGRLCSFDGVTVEESQPVPTTPDKCVVADPCPGKQGTPHFRCAVNGGSCGMQNACAGWLKPMWCPQLRASSPSAACWQSPWGGLETAGHLGRAGRIRHVVCVQNGASPCGARCVTDQRAQRASDRSWPG